MKHPIVTILSFLFSASMVAAQCASDETLYMQCSIEDRDEQMSVCFDDEAAYYRFGRPEQSAELELATLYSTFATNHYANERHLIIADEDTGTVGESVQFVNGDYKYTATMGFYSTWSTVDVDNWGSRSFGNLPVASEEDRQFGSVVVTQNNSDIAHLDCKTSSIIWNRNTLFQSMKAAGNFNWDMGPSGYFEWIYPYSGLPASVPPFACPYSDEIPINFSSFDEQDLLAIEIVGQDCDTADVVLSITTSAGEVVHSSSARALSYTYEFQGADGVRAMLENFMQNQPRSGNNIPSYEEMQDGGYSNVNGVLVTRARSMNLPLFCHQAGKSYSTCFIYSDGTSVALFTSGS